MFPQPHVPVLLTVLSLFAAVRCVTVYGPTGVIGRTTTSSTSTSTAPGTAYTGNGAAAYNQVVLQPPPVPQPPQPTQFSLQLQNNAQNVQGLSIPQNGAFYGFSIEMSVVDQISAFSLAFFPPFLLSILLYSWS